MDSGIQYYEKVTFSVGILIPIIIGQITWFRWENMIKNPFKDI